MDKRYEDLVRFPALKEDKASLSYFEKVLLGQFLLMSRPRLVLELGVFNAVTSRFLCAFLAANGIEAKVAGFDLPETVARLRAEEPEVVDLERRGKLELVPGWLSGSLRDFLARTPDPVDFALVDARHDYRSVTSELGLLWPRLSADGVILCHDYSPEFDGVRYAVDRFATKTGAMAMYLGGSASAQDAGYYSVLVGLRRCPHRRTWSGICHHLWEKTKVDLMENRAFHSVWNRWLRPVLRGKHN